MKKWYFSDNGQVSGPLNINDATSLLAKNNDLYGWNPSFSQWLPVAQIAELSEFISESKPVTQISKELIDKFVSKKRDLNKKIKLIDELIKNTKSNLYTFEGIIKNYNSLTEDLSPEVKANILPIEKKQLLLSKQLTELIRATDIAKNEIIDVVKEFGDLVLSKTSGSSDDLINIDDLPELKQVKKQDGLGQAKAEVELKQPQKIGIKKEVDKAEVILEPPTEQGVLTKGKDVDKGHPSTSVEHDNTAFYDVKSRLKSVFKAKSEEPAISLSEQLKINNLKVKTDDEVVNIDDEINEDLLDDDEEKKTRRRRRRF
ncbi:DUF4339 domain-containing protein [Pseudocolwellia sp. HL-MZ19]|uniref:DUF4339 domain-containing protein n=1 Tax=unclassified Pseudocolwellia TaxID=2848178 RepID=UPI003CEA4E03